MLTHKIHGQVHDEDGPLVVMLHWLGGSARTWTEIAERLARRGFRCAAIDLPGFGDSASVTGYDVASMADAVTVSIAAIRSNETGGAAVRRYLLAGHSMGGKVAAVLARRAANGDAALQGLAGLVLISPSPAGPEPMPDAKRSEMLACLGQSTGDAEEDLQHATKFVTDNVGKLALADPLQRRTVNDVLRMSRSAFRAWLNPDGGGSMEDWSAHVGVLPQPAIVFAGTEDAALGPDAQREHTLPHFATASLVTLQGASHLSPLERPMELVEHIVVFAGVAGLVPSPQSVELSPRFRELLSCERTSPQTREVMLARLGDSGAKQSAFDAVQLTTLRALVECVVPAAPFDLTVRVALTLASGKGDGWRFASLPADLAAWHTGLETLDAAAQHTHHAPFAALHAPQQHDLLQQAQQGKLHRTALAALHMTEESHLFDAAQMQQWFEDVRGELVRLYVADPRIMERIGFTGFADGPATGEGAGFTQIELDQKEAFEETSA